MHFAIWIITFLLIGLWSLLAWGTHALLSLAPALSGPVAPLLDKLPGAPWLDTWVPGWRELTVAMAELTQTVLGWLGGAAPVLVWVLWGVGVAGLVLCALLASGLVAIIRRAIAPGPKVAQTVQASR